MDKEIEEYLTNVSQLLNGQIRGAINKKAREENLELIQITILDIWDTGFNLGQTTKEQEINIELLKKELKDGTGEDNTSETGS